MHFKTNSSSNMTEKMIKRGQKRPITDSEHDGSVKEFVV